MKFIVINIPWPKGAPTLPKWVPRRNTTSLRSANAVSGLIDDLAAKRIDDEWPSSPMLGRMSGIDVTRLHAKHLNHHLKQFGV